MINVKKLAMMVLSLLIMASSTKQLQAQSAQWTLQMCIEYAKKHNITIQKNRINVQSTAIDIKTAQAALFPNLSFSVSQNLANHPYQETNYNGNYGLNSSWTVYNGNRRLKVIDQEKLNNRVAELDVATSENNLEEGIAQIYIQILYAVESAKTNENTLKLSQAQLDRGKELLLAGSISRSDLAQLESQVSNDKFQLVTAQATVQDYKLQLKQLLELDGTQEMDIYLPSIDNHKALSSLPSTSDVYRTALTQRPEIGAGKLNVQLTSLNIDIAKAGYLPSISINAGIGTNNSTGTSFNFSEQLKRGWNNSIGVTLSVPIFSNRQNKSAVSKAKLQLQTSQLNLLDDQKTLFKTIETLWLDANSAQLRFTAAIENLQSTQISYDLISEQFDLGMKNTVELLTAKNGLLSAQQEMLQSKYMAILNAQLLLFYQGNQINL